MSGIIKDIKMTFCFYSNNDDKLPDLKLQNLPKIKPSLPRIQMKDESNLFFDISGETISIDKVADKLGNLFFD